MVSASSTIGDDWLPEPLFSLRLQSAEAFEEQNARGGFAVDFVSESGPGAELGLDGGQCLTMGLWKTQSRTGFTTRPRVQNEVFTVRFVKSGWMLRRHPREEHVGREGHAMLVPFADMQSATASENFVAVSGIISRETLGECHRALGDAGTTLPVFEPVVPVSSPSMRAFMMSFERLHDRLGRVATASDLLFPLLEEIVAYQLLSFWPRRGSSPGRPDHAGATPIQRARDFAEANLARPLRLAELAQVAGISVRSLQHGFKREWSLTPIEFIVERRLQRVHDDLRDESGSGASIAGLARRWGFAHAGDFTRRYRTRFGCTPSETRRRARPGP